jgi:hypothetical protein
MARRGTTAGEERTVGLMTCPASSKFSLEYRCWADFKGMGSELSNTKTALLSSCIRRGGNFIWLVFRQLFLGHRLRR